MSSTVPRLRFAPSPTGMFHVGSGRSALYNWLVARKSGGAFVLRIEDTDAARNQPEWTTGIENAMRWLGMDWDEGPFFQSQRTELYNTAITKLINDKRTFYCDCNGESLAARLRAKHGEKTQERGYDGFCRERNLPGGTGQALRFRTPDEGTTVVHDVVRGEPVFENSTIDDFVVARADGSAMFILANVVDDIDMGITHVVRGEEHLPNTPKTQMLWQALTDEPLPVFAHLAVIVNEQRKKLSKRRDKVAVEDYELMGVVPEAMRNYLCLLGWSPSNDREIVSVETMIDEFRLEDVNPSPAFFDIVKLQAINAEYLRAYNHEQFLDAFEHWLGGLAALRSPWVEFGQAENIAATKLGEGRQEPPKLAFPADQYDRSKVAPLVGMIQERVKILSEVPALIEFLCVDTITTDQDAWDKTFAPGKGGVEMLDGFLAGIDAGTPWETAALKELTEKVGEANALKLGKAQAPLRVAVTGKTVGMPMFESLEALGAPISLARLRAARARLG